MKAIYKYQLSLNIMNKVQEVTMPCNASVIKADFQGSNLVLWAIVNPEDHSVSNRQCAICFSGPMMDEKDAGMRQLITTKNHVETLQRNGLVIHVFVQK